MINLYSDVELYDLVNGSFADTRTFGFYDRQVSVCGAPVLELACGSGHVLIPLAEKGIDVCGLDISVEMLGACERKAVERGVKAKFQIGDMRRFELERQFNLIFITNNSFQHLLENKDVSDCLNCVRRHLAPGGKFVVEVLNPYIPLLIRQRGKKFMVGEFGEYVLTEDVHYGIANQINHKNWHFWHRPTDTIKTLVYSLRQFFPKEFDALFEFNGFRIEKKFGDFDESAFADDSIRQIIVAGVR